MYTLETNLTVFRESKLTYSAWEHCDVVHHAGTQAMEMVLATVQLKIYLRDMENNALKRCILKLDGNKERSKMENRNLLRNKSRPFCRGFPFHRNPVMTERQTFVLIDPCSLIVYSRESPLPLLDGVDAVVYSIL